MTGTGIDTLAHRFGIVLPDGDDGRQLALPAKSILTALGIDVATPAAIAARLAETRLIEPPVLKAPQGATCYLPAWLQTGRAWGISLQLYELRSQRNGGIGDFADLADFCRLAAQAGADFVGVNPLHALFLAQPDRCSPFSPSNRLFLNPLYIAVDRVPGHVATEASAAAAQSLRGSQRVDYAAVAALKLSMLRPAWQQWQRVDDEREEFSRGSFAAFCTDGGEPLRAHALFEALSARMVEDGHGCGWLTWPLEYQGAGSAAVRRFAQDSDGDIRFHMWLQWLAQLQLSQAAAAADEAGMRIGLYLDFAVGEAPDGSATWSHPELSVPGMSIGAPPDMFTAAGQDWGLSPLSPIAMKQTGFAGFRRTNEALMRDAGALRIDHAMALWQLFFVPEGSVPAEGAYVRYPVEDLLRILSQQSRQHRTIVIGEDLGHVPPGFRAVMQQAQILSYRILYFEKDGDRFIRPEAYPRLALACLSTHDMPTLTGWWLGDDVALRLEHGLIDAVAAAEQSKDRDADRAALVALLRDDGGLDLRAADLLPGRVQARAPDALAVAAYRFIARTPSALAAVRLADLTGERAQTNLPGTVDTYPNWRLKSSVTLEDLPSTDLFKMITTAMAAERPRQA